MLLEVKKGAAPSLPQEEPPPGAPPPASCDVLNLSAVVHRRRKSASRIAVPAVPLRKSCAQLVDWDSPSTFTGTVKRRPSIGDGLSGDGLSGDNRASSSSMGTSCSSERSSPDTPLDRPLPAFPGPGSPRRSSPSSPPTASPTSPGTDASRRNGNLVAPSRLKKPNTLAVKKYSDAEDGFATLRRGALRAPGAVPKRSSQLLSAGTIARVSRTRTSPNSNKITPGSPRVDNHKSPEVCDNAPSTSPGAKGSPSKGLPPRLPRGPPRVSNANGSDSSPSPGELNGNLRISPRAGWPAPLASTSPVLHQSASLSSLFLRELEKASTLSGQRGVKVRVQLHPAASHRTSWEHRSNE